MIKNANFCGGGWYCGFREEDKEVEFLGGVKKRRGR